MIRKYIRRRKVYWAHYNYSFSPHPVIRIAGKYLEEFGFTIGDNIEVNLSKHQIVINKSNNAPKNLSNKNT